MAVAHIQTGMNAVFNLAPTTPIPVTLTVSGTPSVPTLLVVTLMNYFGGNSRVIDDGPHQTYTLIDTQVTGSNVVRVSQWYCLNTVTGSLTVGAAMSPDPEYPVIFVSEYSGVAPTSPLVQFISALEEAPGTTVHTAGPLAAATPIGNLLVASSHFEPASNATFTATAPFVIPTNGQHNIQSTAAVGATCHVVVASASTYSATVTSTLLGRGGTILSEFAAAAGGAAAPGAIYQTFEG